MTPEETRQLSESTWLAFNSDDLDGWLACVLPERETSASIEVSLQQVTAVGGHSLGIADVAAFAEAAERLAQGASSPSQ